MEGIELGVSVITGCAIYTIGHIIYLSGSNLGRIVVWSQLQRLSPEEEVVHLLDVFSCAISLCLRQVGVKQWQVIAGS